MRNTTYGAFALSVVHRTVYEAFPYAGSGHIQRIDQVCPALDYNRLDYKSLHVMDQGCTLPLAPPRRDITTVALEPDQVFARFHCQLRRDGNRGIVAIAKSKDDPELTEIRNSWPIDSATPEVADLAAREVRCGNEACCV